MGADDEPTSSGFVIDRPPTGMGADSLGYVLIDFVEESLELIGVVLVVAGIVAHLDRVGIFARPSPAAAPPAGTVSAVLGDAPIRASGRS